MQTFFLMYFVKFGDIWHWKYKIQEETGSIPGIYSNSEIFQIKFDFIPQKFTVEYKY